MIDNAFIIITRLSNEPPNMSQEVTGFVETWHIRIFLKYFLFLFFLSFCESVMKNKYTNIIIF